MRTGDDRVPSDRGGPRRDVCGQEERIEGERLQRRVDAARGPQVLVGGDRVEEGLVDGRVLGRNEPKTLVLILPLSRYEAHRRGKGNGDKGEWAYCDWSVQNGGTSSSSACAVLNAIRSARFFTPVGTSRSSEMYRFTSTCPNSPRFGLST